MTPERTKNDVYYFTPKIVFVTGEPLTGKTTLGKKLAEISNFVHLDVDNVRPHVYPGRIIGNPDYEQWIMSFCYKLNHGLAKTYLLGGQSPVVVTATYSRFEYQKIAQTLIQEV